MRSYSYKLRPKDERDSFREYAQLCEIEPALAVLLLEVMRAQPTTDQFYDWVKPRLKHLAGWSARRPELQTCAAYDTVYELLYSMAYDA
jgi:hypothetical protein